MIHISTMSILILCRYKKYINMAAKGNVDPNKLPPTEDAAYLHTLRSLFQTHVWTSLDTTFADPCSFGWKIVDGVYWPIPSSVVCAPDDLLNLIRCKCKGSCKSLACSCRKHGLSCSVACQNCRGVCLNSKVKIYSCFLQVLFFSKYFSLITASMLKKESMTLITRG